MTQDQYDQLTSALRHVPITGADGGAVATFVKSLRDMFLPCYGRVTHSIAFNIINATVITPQLDTVYWIANVTWTQATGRFTVQYPGIYFAWANASMSSNAGGIIRQIRIIQNGSVITGVQAVNPGPAGAIPQWSASTMVFLNAGDTMEMQLYQDSGATLSVLKSLSYSPEFGICRMTGF